MQQRSQLSVVELYGTGLRRLGQLIDRNRREITSIENKLAELIGDDERPLDEIQKDWQAKLVAETKRRQKIAAKKAAQEFTEN